MLLRSDARCQAFPHTEPATYAPHAHRIGAGRSNSGKLTGMFVIELSYKVPLKDIDASMPAHMSFLKKYYATGHFLVSGRKVPRNGGIILAVGENRAQIEAIAREDPFYARGLADVRVVEFRVSQRSEAMQTLVGR